MRNQTKFHGAPALAAAALLFSAFAGDSSSAAPAAANSTSVFNFSEASQRGASPPTEDHTGKAPVPEPATWVNLAALLGVCAGLAASGNSKKPRS